MTRKPDIPSHVRASSGSPDASSASNWSPMFSREDFNHGLGENILLPEHLHRAFGDDLLVALDSLPELVEHLAVDEFAVDVALKPVVVNDVDRVLAHIGHRHRPLVLVRNQPCEERPAGHRVMRLLGQIEACPHQKRPQAHYKSAEGRDA